MSAPIPEHVKAAAIIDYYSGTDRPAVVAARHGIARSTFAAWVENRDKEIGLTRGRWVLDPVRRIQRWEVS